MAQERQQHRLCAVLLLLAGALAVHLFTCGSVSRAAVSGTHAGCPAAQQRQLEQRPHHHHRHSREDELGCSNKLNSTTTSELRLAAQRHHFQATFTSRWEMYNPCIVVDEQGNLHMYTRIEGRNQTGTYSMCPRSSLQELWPCPVQHIRMISFLAHCQLDANLQCG